MAIAAGRDFLVKRAGAAIAAQQTTSVSVDNSPVDITSKDDGGFRTLASFAGTRSLTITSEGPVDDEVLQDAAFGTTSLLLTDITLDFGGGNSISGDFYLASLEHTGEHGAEERQSVTFESSSAWTYTDAV